MADMIWLSFFSNVVFIWLTSCSRLTNCPEVKSPSIPKYEAVRRFIFKHPISCQRTTACAKRIYVKSKIMFSILSLSAPSLPGPSGSYRIDAACSVYELKFRTVKIVQLLFTQRESTTVEKSPKQCPVAQAFILGFIIKTTFSKKIATI